MVLGLFKKDEGVEESPENFIELDQSSGDIKQRINVRIEDLRDYRDIETVQRLVREGNIVFLKIKTLRDKNLGELKRAVQKLRKGSIAMNGDIVGVDDNFLVLCPQFARVFRESPEEMKVQ
ncbi:MAG: cell division protein SepF [Candidatus Aenigmarchaeota archaeon]|nr:cell division protein SepF [Candidatus Aenigmarchaeota archaeon]PIW41091.1 MAG: hypothetical protein COW21_03840 [Candidatus Aenigmarchaeota archaeon CG15_BIG_FIL_POST_REV_8_21_14_020_37_27]PIY35740.1 MAG: hypothetical protein COZ04_02300 [Candidatus Aenigmarchaeota archaeon CG_4_10_14_3_um_filter_37_21]